MDFVGRVLTYYSYVSHQRLIYTLSDVHVLEKFVISLLLVKIVENSVSFEKIVIYLHQ